MRAHIPYEQGGDGVNLRRIQINDIQNYTGWHREMGKFEV
jgi:hypothetical protein